MIVEVSCRYPVGRLLRTKEDVGVTVCDVLAMLERQSRLKVHCLRCNDEASRDDGLITLNVMRERRELDRVSWWIVLPTYTLFLFVYVYA